MTTALDRIIAYKHDEVAALKQAESFESFSRMASEAGPVRGFAAAMDRVAAQDENALICELKRKSPSAGEILPGADPVAIAKEYESGGAACLSVLTDGPSFGGSLADFAAIRSAVSLPMLRKDFLVDTIQVAEARVHGADCILVILSAVDDACARDLIAASSSLGMDTIVEVHDEAELERANALSSPLVGINNRDLKRMVTDLSVTERLAARLDPSKSLISESGISEPAHIQRLSEAGARRFLIGESLMKSSNRRQACTNLRNAIGN